SSIRSMTSGPCLMSRFSSGPAATYARASSDGDLLTNMSVISHPCSGSLSTSESTCSQAHQSSSRLLSKWRKYIETISASSTLLNNPPLGLFQKLDQRGDVFAGVGFGLELFDGLRGVVALDDLVGALDLVDALFRKAAAFESDGVDAVGRNFAFGG